MHLRAMYSPTLHCPKKTLNHKYLQRTKARLRKAFLLFDIIISYCSFWGTLCSLIKAPARSESDKSHLSLEKIGCSWHTVRADNMMRNFLFIPLLVHLMFLDGIFNKAKLKTSTDWKTGSWLPFLILSTSKLIFWKYSFLQFAKVQLLTNIIEPSVFNIYKWIRCISNLL